MFAEQLRGTNNLVIDGVCYTNNSNVLFIGRNINNVLMNVALRAMKSRDLIELYECKVENRKLRLLNGINTKPFTSAVSADSNGVAYITDGYLSTNKQYINWNTIGAVGYMGNIVWTHPDLVDNIRWINKIDKPIHENPLVAKRLSKEEPYRNLTEFKKWLSTGKTLRVIDWHGKRNRRGMLLTVTEVVKTRGFHFNAYFGNRKVGVDFIPFQTANCYEFKTGGVIHVYSNDASQLLYVLEPYTVR